MQWVNAAIQGILVGGLYALFATGLSLAFGVMRFVNLAHGDSAILAAYLVLSVSAVFGIGYWASLVLVIVIMAVVGYVGQRGLFNFTLGEDPLPGILVSFGVGIVIQNALQQHYTATDRTIDLGPILTKSITINDDISIGWFPLLTLDRRRRGPAGAAAALLPHVDRPGLRRDSGRPETAQLMGINDRRLYGVAMAIAFATIALAGFFRARGPRSRRRRVPGSCCSPSRPSSSAAWARCGERSSAGSCSARAEPRQPGVHRVGPALRPPGLPVRAPPAPAGPRREGART